MTSEVFWVSCGPPGGGGGTTRGPAIVSAFNGEWIFQGLYRQTWPHMVTIEKILGQ